LALVEPDEEDLLTRQEESAVIGNHNDDSFSTAERKHLPVLNVNISGAYSGILKFFFAIPGLRIPIFYTFCSKLLICCRKQTKLLKTLA
jgi:hypothetical protein